MKYFEKSKQWRASNVTLQEGSDGKPESAYSWSWWKFMARLPNGKLLFNHYGYSPSTRRHQSKVLRLLKERYGIEDYLGWEFGRLDTRDVTYLQFTNKSLSNPVSAIEDELDQITMRQLDLYGLISKKGTRKTTNARRLQEIAALHLKSTSLKGLLNKLTGEAGRVAS